MSVSTDGILIYGYCWQEEQSSIFPSDGRGEDEDDSGDEWEERLLRKRGVSDPWDNYPPDIEALPYEEQCRRSNEWMRTNDPALDAWHDAKDAVKREFGIEVGQHCSDGCSMPYLAAFELTASRGYPKEVLLPLPDTAEMDARLAKFVAEFGITTPQDRPRWWLCSYWG